MKQDNSSFESLMSQLEQKEIEKKKEICKVLGLDDNNLGNGTWANTGAFNFEEFENYLKSFYDKSLTTKK